LVAYVRTVKTSSGATAVQIVWSTRRGSRKMSRKIEHLGSAHDQAGVAALKAAAAQRLATGQAQLDLGLAARSESEPLPITSSNAALLWEALCCAYEILGLDEAADGDRLARSVVHAANIIEHAQTQGWSLVVLDLNLDLTTAAGRMMARTVVNFAEYERELMLDRDAPGSSVQQQYWHSLRLTLSSALPDTNL
jgi:hypothetical protein